nr:reverse transcriptase domain-containing protein [Tanacetum cinerariifolium]
MADTHTMAELLRAPIEGNAKAIIVPPIPTKHFELKHSLLNLVTSKQFFGFEKEDPHAHIRWFNKITSTMKYKDVPETAIKLMLFPFSIDGPARIWLEKEPPRFIETWDDLVSKFINKFFPTSKTTNLRNEISNFQQRFDEPFHETWDRFKDLICACPHHGFTKLHRLDTFYNSLNPSDQDSLNFAAGGNLLEKSTQDALKIIENKSKVRTSRNKPVVAKVSTNTSTSGLSPDVAALTDVVKALLLKNTTPPPASVKAVEESCVTCGGPHPYYNCPTTNANAKGYQDNIQAYVFADAVNYNHGNAGYCPPSVAHQSRPPGFPPVPNNQNRGNNYTPGNSTYRAPIPPIASSNELANYLKVTETHMRAIQNQINIMKTELRNEFQATIFSYALLYMPKFTSTFKNLFSHKEKLFEVATNILVNENCSAVILKKLLEKLGDPGKFLIPYNFSEIPECLALADLGASINLMPLSIWRKLSLPELNPTQMILELTDQSTTRPTGIAEDVFVRVGKFHFSADFVVVDYDVDPRVPLILERPFLRTVQALIDVYSEELTLRVGDEAVTFKVCNTTKFSNNDAESINRIDVIDVALEEYSHEVLGFSGNSESGNPTLASEPIIARSSPSLTPFKGEENTDVSLPEYECLYSEGDIHLLEKFLNEYPSSPLLPKESKTEELKSVKSSIDEPPELELKDLCNTPKLGRSGILGPGRVTS